MQTIRYAIRSLKTSPGYTAVAVLALALGIGANTAIFSLVEAIFLSPLPYRDAGRLVQVNSSDPERQIVQAGMSWPRLEVLRSRQDVFSDLSVSTFNAYTVTGLGEPEQVFALMVSQNFFSLLGIEPVLGRSFSAEDERPGGPPVVLLSYGFWQSHFGGQRDVLGKTVTLDGQAHTILGVLPASASGFPLAQMQLFTPRPFEAPFLTRKQIDDGGYFFNVIARLKPGVGLARARTELDAIQKTYAETHESNVDSKSAITVGYLLDNLVGNQRETYATLFAAVADVDPMIALTNPGTLEKIVDQSMANRKLTMNLLLVFAGLALLLATLGVYSVMAYSVAQRTDEIGVRMALGAGAKEVLLMVLRQGMTLAGIGLALGFVAALALTRLMGTMLFSVGASDPIVYLSIAALLAATAGFACWIPSRRAALVDPATALRSA